MYYYSLNGRTAASFLPQLPFPQTEPAQPEVFLLQRSGICRAAFA